MNIRGLDTLRSHLPNPGRLPFGIATVFLLTSLFLLAADRYFVEWMPDGEIVVLALGFLILSRFFSQRKRYQEQYGSNAYTKAILRFHTLGIGIILAGILHLGYIAGPPLPNVWWRAWLIALGFVLLIMGLMLWIRSVLTLGIDRVLMLYVYYPGQDTELSSGIYAILRHPIYAAAQNVAFGLALIHANWYALLVAVLLPLFYAGWIRLIEEPELLTRHPEYAEYRRRVPAFSPALTNIGRFWRYLFTGD